MGLLDSMMDDPQSVGLLNAAAQILQQSGNVRQPYSLGQAMGTGISGYMQGSAAARARKQQEEEQAQAMQMRQMQIEQAKREQAQAQAQQQRQSQLQQYLRGAPQSQPQGQQAALSGTPQQSMPGMPQPQQQAAGGAQDPFGNRMQRAAYLRQGGYSQEADAEEVNALKFQKEVKNWEKVRVGDRVMLKPYYKDGSDGPPVSQEMAEKLEFRNLNNRDAAFDSFTGKEVASYARGQSADSVAGNAVTMRGQNMKDARDRDLNEITRQGQRTQIINDPMQGPLLIDKGTGLARQAIGINGAPIRGEAVVKKEASAKGLMPILDAAEKLIDGATGSYLGAIVDEGARYYGGSTSGAKNIAQLKVMEGQIMMNQPRMEGPQSNMDVQLYRQMAALIGDPTVPSETKKAAFGTLREITARNSGGPQAVTPKASGGWSIKRVD